MPMAKATHSTIDALDETVDQLEALTFMLGETLAMSDFAQSHGIVALFRSAACALRDHCETFRAGLPQVEAPAPQRRHLTTANVPTDAERLALRREYIGLIMRDTDTTTICERYAIPKETQRDILYAMIDAPQKAMTVEGLRDLNSGPLPAHMRPVEPIKPLDEHFREEAIMDRLTGSAADETDAG